MGAATREPWVWETSSLSTRAERFTISRHRPAYAERPIQLRQKFTVSLNAVET